VKLTVAARNASAIAASRKIIQCRAASRKRDAPLSFIIVAFVNCLIHLPFNARANRLHSILSFHFSFVGLLDHHSRFLQSVSLIRDITAGLVVVVGFRQS